MKIVSMLIEKLIVLNISNKWEAMLILPIVKIRPIKEAIKPTITVAKYFPIINCSFNII